MSDPVIPQPQPARFCGSGHNLIVPVMFIFIAFFAWVTFPDDKVVEKAAPAEIQSDGSTLIERTATDAKAKPAHAVPAGGKVERIVSLKVKPHPAPAAGPAQPAADCPPVDIDLSLVRMPDQSRRVVASSSNGDIVSGLDIPVETPAEAVPHRWAAGLSFNPMQQTGGVWIERDIGRVRAGLDINQSRALVAGPLAVEARFRVGVTW